MKNDKLKKVIMGGIILMLIALSGVVGRLSANSQTVDEIQQIQEIKETVEEPTEEVVEEVVEDKKPTKKASTRNNISVTSVNTVKGNNNEATEEVVVREVKLTVETTTKNPTVVVGEKEVNASLFGIKVMYDGTNIASTCSITLNKSGVNMTKNGTYDVTISADCGEKGRASRIASVTIYVPKADEAPKAASKNDTSIATETPEVKTTRDAIEMTKVTVIMNDGSEVTFVKDEVENIYAVQKERVLSESSLPSNYVISGNTLTVNGKTFTAR
jgi:hypothetical protein